MEKATQEGYTTELFMPIMKEANGKYIAVLSDNSVDRDDEKLSKGCVEKLGLDDGYLAALCNHSNDVFMLVAEWTNRGIKEVDGFTALVAEPKFYKSNPRAKEIKGMLDEGAKIGISIGAIVKTYDEIDGMKVFTELELLEASFVAIPSNRHGRAMAVAKSYNKSKEAIKMDEKFTQKDIDSAIEKKVSELEKSHKEALLEKETEVTKLTKDLEDSAKLVKEADEAKTEAEEAKDKVETEAEEAKVEAEKKVKEVESKALEKQKFVDQGGDNSKTSPEDTEEAFKAGKLPIMKIQ